MSAEIDSGSPRVARSSRLNELTISAAPWFQNRRWDEGNYLATTTLATISRLWLIAWCAVQLVFQRRAPHGFHEPKMPYVAI